MRWTHRRTWKDSKHPQNDRTVVVDGKPVARVTYRNFGASKGQWFWFGLWGGPNHHGQEPNLNTALSAVRKEYHRLHREDPTRLKNLTF